MCRSRKSPRSRCRWAGLCGFGAGPSFVGSSRGEKSWVWVAKGLPPSSGGGGIIAVGGHCLLSSFHRGKLRYLHPLRPRSYVFEQLASGWDLISERPTLCAKPWPVGSRRHFTSSQACTFQQMLAETRGTSRSLQKMESEFWRSEARWLFCGRESLSQRSGMSCLTGTMVGWNLPTQNKAVPAQGPRSRHPRPQLGNAAQGPSDGVALFC